MPPKPDRYQTDSPLGKRQRSLSSPSEMDKPTAPNQPGPSQGGFLFDGNTNQATPQASGTAPNTSEPAIAPGNTEFGSFQHPQPGLRVPATEEEQRVQREIQARYLNNLQQTYDVPRQTTAANQTNHTPGPEVNYVHLPRGPSFVPTPTFSVNDDLPGLPNGNMLLASTIEKPPKYGGRRENDACVMWLRRLDLHVFQLEISQRRIYNDQERIFTAANFFKDDAFIWYAEKHQAATLAYSRDSDPKHISWLYNDYALFRRMLIARFGDTRTMDTRYEDYWKIRQTGTVLAYKEKIQSAASGLDPPPSDYELLRKFKQDMNYSLRQRIEFLPDDQIPHEFDAYCQYADKLERQIQNQNRNGKGHGSAPRSWPRSGYSGGSNTKAKVEAKVDADGDTIMSLFAMEARQKAEKEKLLQHCRDNDLCFRCAKAGHRSFECPQATPAPNAKPGKAKTGPKDKKKGGKSGKGQRR
jgi:hypothetical protein